MRLGRGDGLADHGVERHAQGRVDVGVAERVNLALPLLRQLEQLVDKLPKQ